MNEMVQVFADGSTLHISTQDKATIAQAKERRRSLPERVRSHAHVFAFDTLDNGHRVSVAYDYAGTIWGNEPLASYRRG